ncbi:MAG TPA: GatB/YqeY domain-containing protein [Gemmatimonadales bacterium]|nr:GatB/YqeY domain-containing protein [Gemmatimonadales bacterium]
MADLLARLQSALVTARKAQDKERTLVLSTLVAQVKDHELKLSAPLTDADVVDVLRKGVKTRGDSIEQYEKAGRPELAARERAQVRVIEEFLPAAVDPAEIRAAAQAAVAAGAKDVGAVMKALMPQFKGRADGKLINELAREALQAG